MDEGRMQASVGRVDANSASAETLSEVVDGLGPVLAERIVAYRQTHGPFTALEQLVAVQGIGPRSLQGFIDQLTLGGQAPMEGGPSEPALEGEVVAGTESVDREARVHEGEPAAAPPEPPAEPVTEPVAAAEAAPTVEPAWPQEPVEALEAAPEGLEVEAEGEEQEPLHTAEEVSERAALELEAQLGEVEIEELSLYTRTSAQDTLSEWTPPTPAEGAAPTGSESEAVKEPAEAEGQEPEAHELAADEPVVSESAADEPQDQEFMVEPDLAQVTLEAAPVSAGEGQAPRLTKAESAQEPRGEEVGTMAQEAAAISAPVGARAGKEEVREVRRGSFWRGLGLVLLGGLLGVILTLVAAIIWSGTVDFAPRQEVNALSRNLNTMQANQELAWERLDQLTVGAQELGRQVEQLQTLSDRVASTEDGLQAAQRELAAAQSALDAASESIAALEQTLESGLNTLDERVTTTEDQIQTMGSVVDDLQSSMDTVEARMTSFDTFFTALRDLLIDMQGGLEAISGAETEPAPTKAP
ncbi:MAG: helix-hairpin-helix domain-containing protein [Anaerolineae bacterium]|nr:helix-hairpin-helix domain-containing protein [Anaerolineae bacterium]